MQKKTRRVAHCFSRQGPVLPFGVLAEEHPLDPPGHPESAHALLPPPDMRLEPSADPVIGLLTPCYFQNLSQGFGCQIRSV